MTITEARNRLTTACGPRPRAASASRPLTLSAARVRLHDVGVDPFRAVITRQRTERLALGRIHELQQHARALVQRFGLTWIITGEGKKTFFARPKEKCVFTQAIECEEDFAGFLHEVAHVVRHRCVGPGHHRDTTEKGSYACVACEVDAWEGAIELAKPFEFTPAMRLELTRGLNSYRKFANAEETAVVRLERLIAKHGVSAPPARGAQVADMMRDAIRAENVYRFSDILTKVRALPSGALKCRCGKVASTIRTKGGEERALCDGCHRAN